jgi:HAMP domain-containing protein
MVADLFTNGVAAALDFRDADAASAELGNLRENPEVLYAAVWLANGTAPFAEMVRGERPRDEPKADPRFTVKEDRVEVVRAVTARDGKIVGSAIVYLSLAAENAAYATTLRRTILVGSITAAVVLGLLVLLVRRQILGPLEVLAGAARQVERGEAGAALDTRADDELGDLARAFEAMKNAIFDREASLSAANRSLEELFDNMRQGIVVFGADGRVTGTASRRAFALFAGKGGRPLATLQGACVVDLLYPEALDGDPEATALTQWTEVAFEAPPESWDEVAELAPKEALLFAGEPNERLLELEVRPITEDGKTRRIMLLATDATEKRRLMREVEAQGAQHAREMAALRKLVAGGGQAFVGFLASSAVRIERCRAIASDGTSRLKPTQVIELMQHVHTMRGEARVFELRELAAHLDALEDQLARARKAVSEAPEVASLRETVRASLQEAEALLERARQMFVAASPLGEGALDQATVRKKDVALLVGLAGQRSDALGEVVRRLASRPFGEAASMLAEQAPTWAEALEKRAHLRIEGREVLVPPALAGVLAGVLSHFVRNAIAHGIEPPEEREQKQKQASGEIVLSCATGRDAGPVIAIEDDGRGLPEDEIIARAKELGIYEEGAAPANLIVHAGFSTAMQKTELAGLGVGLTAARADLASAGYRMTVESHTGRGTKFVLSPADPTTRVAAERVVEA